MAFLHVQNHQHLLPSPPPPPPTTYNHLTTLDLFHTPSPSSTFHIQLLQNYYSPVPFACDHNFFNLKTGETISSSSEQNRELEEEETKMSRRNGSGPKLDLKLNLSPPRANPHMPTPSRSATVSPTSPPSSCVSSELNQEDGNLRYSSSPESASMVLVGCPRCLMYVMLSEEDPRCPKCKSTVLLDVLQDNNSTKKTRN